jgi:hypothetical protein
MTSRENTDGELGKAFEACHHEQISCVIKKKYTKKLVHTCKNVQAGVLLLRKKK